MAYTVVKTPNVIGNQAAVHLEITADAATQTIETGLKNIVAMSVGKDSMASNGHTIAVNSGAGGTATRGVLGISGVASGDHFFVTVYGTR
jgi:hypothetical protein